jgi:hypothetical protein
MIRPLLWQYHKKEWVYFKLQRISEVAASGLAALPEKVAKHRQTGGHPILNTRSIHEKVILRSMTSVLDWRKY